MNLPAPLVANPAAQQPQFQTIDEDDHLLVVFFHPGDRLGFQSELFPDKSFYEHLDPTFRCWAIATHNNQIGRRCSFHQHRPQLQAAKRIKR